MTAPPLARLVACLFVAGFSASTTAASPEAGLERLFFTPEQRRQLEQHWERLRQPHKNGEIERHDGRRTRWLNGQKQVLAPASAASPPDKRP